MQAIETKYLGPTNHRGARIKATTAGGDSVTVSYDYASHDPHGEAVKALLIKTGWKGNMISGGSSNGRCVWVFVDGSAILENPNGE